MIGHLTEPVKSAWKTDGDIRAFVMRIENTGAAFSDYRLTNPLGRLPVGVMIIKKYLPSVSVTNEIEIYVKSESTSSLVVQFSKANLDVVIRIW